MSRIKKAPTGWCRQGLLVNRCPKTLAGPLRIMHSLQQAALRLYLQLDFFRVTVKTLHWNHPFELYNYHISTIGEHQSQINRYPCPGLTTADRRLRLTQNPVEYFN